MDRAVKYEPYLLPSILILTLALFLQVAGYEFVNYDDNTFVVLNEHIRSGITLRGIAWAFTSPYEANWIPLTWISHMLDVQLFGMNPAGHHLVNLLFHLGSTSLLFMYLRGATGAPWHSAAVAIAFALHPLHVESVAWVAERKDVLSAFFWMATLCAYRTYTSNPGCGRYLITLGLFTLGLLAKPMLVTLPLVLLLLDWWPLGRCARPASGEGTGCRVGCTGLLAEKIPFFLLAAGAGIMTMMSQERDISNNYGFGSKVARATVTYLGYLEKAAWPTKLAVLYPFSDTPPSPLLFALSATFLLTVTAVVIVSGRSHPYLLMGWGWYLVTLLPVIGVVQIGHHSMADRYTYLPLIGIFISIAWGLPHLIKARWALSAVAIITFAAMMTLTFLQLRYWKTSVTLFTHAIQVTERNWVAHNNLGQALLDRGDVHGAITQFSDAVSANPSSALAFLNLGLACRITGDISCAVVALRQALRCDAGCYPAHLGLGLTYLDMGKPELARMEYEYLRNISPGDATELLRAFRPTGAGR